MDDPRFKRFATDPKFRPVPKKERKVKIDPRFKSMFVDKKFVDKVSVDKRGRPKNFATKENFEKFYDLESSEDEEGSGSDAEKVQETIEVEKSKSSNKDKKLKKDSEKVKSPKETKKLKNDEDIEQKILEKLRNSEIDYARGEGRLVSDSSSEDSSSEEESDSEDNKEVDEKKFDKWGELDHDAERTDDSTCRIGVCNMDWDRVGAKDIFIALSSFCPPGGTVRSVKIFLSDFGKQRLEEEETLGPPELREGSSSKKKDDDFNNFDDDGEIDPETMEKIRVYQVNRLKYYYAVADFDSVGTADKVYQECDGMEYELSATRFDLRFIPDDMSFDEESPKESCDQMPHPGSYKPKFFNTTALKQGKVNLTWDEPDHERIAALRKAFDASDDDNADDDVKAYLANSSDDEDAEKDNANMSGNESGEDENEDDVVAKYKSLISDIKNKEKKAEENSKDLEVSWVPSDVITEKMKEEELEAMTPWEQYLQKKKDKRKAKKSKQKKSAAEQSDEDKPFSDDELPDGVDMDDPFFKSLNEEDPSSNKKKNKKKGKKKSAQSQSEETEEKSGLSLLLMESDDDKDHFDYKDIVKNEQQKKKKKKQRKAEKQKQKQTEDNFKIDLGDNRFSAIFNQAEYNVDPSNPNFKKTKSMQALIDEKQKRRNRDQDGHEGRTFSEGRAKDEPAKKKLKENTSSLDSLVHAVKSKSKRMKLDKK